MNTSSGITLSMIVKNEEKYLEECLNSVKDLVDEIIIVDTGSSDNTLEIAKTHNALIYTYKWINDFSAARNFALGKSTGSWILYMDADERLSKESVIKIKEITQRFNKTDKVGLRCFVNNIDEKNGKPKLMRYARFFRNTPEISFSGKVHEQIEDSLITNGYDIIDTDIEIIHIGYNIGDEGIKEKAQRNLDLLLTEYKENNSAYYAFHLGNTYEILQDYQTAVYFYKIALEDERLNKAYRSVCYLHIADYYDSEVHDLKTADQMIAEGLKSDPENPLLNLLASQISFKSGNLYKAISLCRLALESNKKINNRNPNNSVLEINIKPGKICAFGLYLTLSGQDSQWFNFFYKQADKNTQEYIALLLELSPLNSFSIVSISQFINYDNLNLILLLLERREEKKSSLEIMLAVKEKFSDNAKFLITLGNIYIQLGNEIDQGIYYLKESLKQKQKDPSAVFYLISILIQQNKLSEIPEILTLAENEFGHIPLFNEKFQILIQKLGALIR